VGMKRLYFRVSARPVPKARARVTYKGHGYTPRRTRAFEERVAWEAKAAMLAQGWDLTSQPVSLELTFHQAHPLADLTNLCKSVEDACNCVVWLDDKQVRSLVAQFGNGAPGVDVVVEMDA
jgi:Holliday junction resolvase RusA-like endonuclease